MSKRTDKKILIFQPNNNYSGSCRVLLTTIQSDFDGWDYKVVTTGRDGFLSQVPDNRFVEIKYPRFLGKIVHGPSYFFYVLKLFFIALYYGFRYRQFYVNTIMPYPAALAGRLIGCSVTYHVHEKFLNPDIRERAGAWFLMHLKAKRIYVSNYLREAYHDTSNESEVKYNKLSKDFLDGVNIVPVEERKRNTIVLVSALPSKEKGVDLYYELAKICPDKKFLLVTGQPEEAVVNFLGGKELPNLFIYQGGKNVGKYLQWSDLLINMSNPFFSQETFGMTILEGMAYGLPAIVPNAGGPKELVEDGYNGYKVDVTDLEGIKKLIEKILDENNYQTYCANAMTMFNKLNG